MIPPMYVKEITEGLMGGSGGRAASVLTFIEGYDT